jgi:hypothetical protein
MGEKHYRARGIVTVEQLDAMTPEERRKSFEASVVDPATLTPEQLAAIYAEQEVAARRVTARVRRRAMPE